jgi:hypothetical protein
LSQILSATLQSAITYELSALVGNPSVYNGGVTGDYRIELVAGGVVIATDSGPSPANDTYWTTASLSFTPEGDHAQLGEPLEIRLIAVEFLDDDNLNFDDVRLYSYTDQMNPSPYDGESVTPPYPPESSATGDEVILSWTNPEPNTLGEDLLIDVWFGLNPDIPNKPGNWEKVLEGGENMTSVTVNAPIIEPEPTAYYWKVNSYTDGPDPNISEGFIYRFYATTDLPLEFVDAGKDMITWDGEPLQLEGTVVDEGTSALTYAWTATPGIGVEFSATDVEDPIITIAKPGEVPVANAGFESPRHNDGDYDYLEDWPKPTGWGWFGTDYVGNWNPGNGAFGSIAPEGTNVGFAEGDSVGEGGFAQILTETLKAETTYMLLVEVGNTPIYDWGAYKIQLLAGGIGTPPGQITGGTLLAEDDNTLAPAVNTFETSTIVYTSGDANEPNIGQPLQIRLIAKEGSEEIDFDNVRLFTEPPRASSPAVHTVELTLAVNDELNTTPVTDTMEIDVYEDACSASRLALGLAADNIADIDSNCITDLEDFVEMALTWLVDYTLTAPVEKP